MLGTVLAPVAAATTRPTTASAATPTPSPTASVTSTASPSPSGTATQSSRTGDGDRARAAERRATEERAEQRRAAAERAAQEKAAAEAAAAAKKAEEAARAAAEHAHDAAELVAASQALAKAQADLLLARQTLLDAEDQLQRAKDVDAAAQTDLDAAVLAEQRAARELLVVETRLQARQEELGQLARNAYQNNGSLGELAVVLSATTPEQLADRIAFLQSIGAAGNAVIAELAEARADLLNAQARLSAARERAQEQRLAAAAALAEVKAKETLAEQAADQVESVVKLRREAFEDARRAAIEDRKRYRTLVVESGALGSRIVELSRELARTKNPPKGTGQFIRPGTGAVTSEYGPRLHPILDYVKVHTGTDFGAGDGVAYAADDGVVLFTEFNVAYGNMTVIDHGRVGGLRIATLYAHQAVSGVQAGDRVTKGQAIGVIGSTGYSTGPHLHFEVRVDGEPLDPGPFLKGAALPNRLPSGLLRDLD